MESFVHSFIKAFGWSILHSFWQGAVLFAILYGVFYLMPALSAKRRHDLAFLSILLMFAWFIKTFIAKWETPLPEMLSGLSISGLASNSVGNIPSGFSANAEAVFPIVIITYLIGFFVQAFMIARGYIYLIRLRRSQIESPDPFWVGRLQRMSEEMGIKRTIRLQVSKLVKSPMVVGYIKPVILLPIGFCSYFTTEQVEAILIHELTHIRRHDYLLNLLKTIIETILFFNPFVWLAGRFIQIERENACDDKVLARIQKPLLYANALLTLETAGASSAPDFALGAMGKTQYLFHRIKRITNMKSNYLNVRQQIAAIFIAIAGLASLAWIQPGAVKITKYEAPVETPKINAVASFTPNEPLNIQETPVAKKLVMDTVPKKSKMKITITDDNGVQKEYSSIDELPDSLKVRIDGLQKSIKLMSDSIKYSFKNLKGLDSFATNFSYKFNNKEFKTQMDDIAKNFNSEDFKKQFKALENQIKSPEFKSVMDKFSSQFDSKEFKSIFDNINSNEEFKKSMEKYKEKMNDPKFKAEQKKMIQDLQSGFTFSTDSLFFNGKNANILINGKSVEKMKQEQELRNSQEYQKLKKKFDAEVEKLRQKEAKKSAKTANA